MLRCVLHKDDPRVLHCLDSSFGSIEEDRWLCNDTCVALQVLLRPSASIAMFVSSGSNRSSLLAEPIVRQRVRVAIAAQTPQACSTRFGFLLRLVVCSSLLRRRRFRDLACHRRCAVPANCLELSLLVK